jgi:outer membrane protein assembly factor BamB
LLDGDRLILNLGAKKRSAGIVALNRKTGETLWTATQETASHATPVAATIHGRRFAFVLTELNLVAINPENGAVYWTYPFHAKTRDLGKLNATSPLVHDDCVLLSTMQVGTACLEILPSGGYEERWRVGPRVLDSQYNNLVAIDDRLFGWSSLNRTLRQLDIATGKVQWKWPGEMGRGAWSIALGNRLLLFGETGRLAAIEVGKPDPHLLAMSEPLLTGPCYAAPALSRGLLFLRNESTLLCLDLSQRRR